MRRMARRSTRCWATAMRRQPNQRFVLKKPPTTYLSAPTASGVASTLEVRVNGVRWDEVPSLYGAAPERPRLHDPHRQRREDDADLRRRRAGRAPADRHGQRRGALPQRHRPGRRGRLPATLTMLRAMPLGLRGVTNAVPAERRRGPGAAGRRAPQRAVDLADLRARGVAARLRELCARLPGHRQGARRRVVDRRAPRWCS